MNIRALTIGASVLSLSACVAAPVPALRVAPSERDQSELREVIADVLGTQVVIGREAFVDNYRLSLGPPMTAQTERATGRLTEPPAIFELRTRAGQCYLVHADTGKTQSLNDVRCRAIER